MPQAALSAAPSTRSTARRSRFPFVLTRGTERFEGLNVLEEVEDDAGVLLWRSLRSVLLWARTPVRRRAALFEASAAEGRAADLSRLPLDHELFAPLSVFLSLLERPAEVDVPRLVNACRRVMRWAEDRGSLATALDFAQAAALVSPGSAGLAYDVGRLSRRRAEYDRAQSWYTRAIVLGRRTGDWRHYARAHSGLSNLLVQKGNLPGARKAALRCLNASERHGLAEFEAVASYDLFVVDIEMGAGPEADVHAERAFRRAPAGHSMIPRLAFDVAYHWTNQGFFSPALRVARALRGVFPGAAERTLVESLVARSAGGVGDELCFRDAARETWALVRSGAVEDTAARALLGVAHGAASLGWWQYALEAAEAALVQATSRSEGRLLIAAEAALEAIRAGAETQRKLAVHPRPETETLSCDLAEALVPAGVV